MFDLLRAGETELFPRLACKVQKVVNRGRCYIDISWKRRPRCVDCKSCRQNGCLQRQNWYLQSYYKYWADEK